MPEACSLADLIQFFLWRLVAIGLAILLMGCRLLTVRSRGCPLQPEGAPPALSCRRHASASDSFQRALIHCTLGAALQPPAGPLAFSRRLALGSEFVELLIERFPTFRLENSCFDNMNYNIKKVREEKRA